MLVPDGPAAPSVFNATDRTSGPVYDRMGITGQGVRRDNCGQINRFGFPGVSVVHGVEVYF